MELVWDNEKIFKLIELYHKQRYVWDSSMNDYKNKAKKSDAWDNISKAMEIPRRDIESKMHTLRSQFSRERKKMAGNADSEKCKWIFYDPLKFLVGVSTTTITHPTTSTMVRVNDKNYRSESERPPTASSPSPPPRSPPPASSIRLKKEKRDIGDNLSDILKIVKRAKTDESKDEFDIYGQYVASELRATKNESAVLKAKSLINNILIDMRLGKYNTHEREARDTKPTRQNSLPFENIEIEEFIKSESVSDNSNSDN